MDCGADEDDAAAGAGGGGCTGGGGLSERLGLEGGGDWGRGWLGDWGRGGEGRTVPVFPSEGCWRAEATRWGSVALRVL